MTTTQHHSPIQHPSPVQLHAADEPGQPTPTPALEELYRGFEKELLVPLWTEIGDLMPAHPQSKAQPHLWRWNDLLPLAQRAGELVPVGRGGERRAIALAAGLAAALIAVAWRLAGERGTSPTTVLAH